MFFFSKIARHYLGIGMFSRTFPVRTNCTVFYGTPCYYTSLILFFFDEVHIIHKIKHKQSMARWHDLVQVDRTSRLYIPVKQARTVRAKEEAAAAATNISRVPHQSNNAPSSSSSFIYLFFVKRE